MITGIDPHHDLPCEYGFDGDRWFHRTNPGVGTWQVLKRPRITEKRVKIWADMVQLFYLTEGSDDE